MLTPANYRLKTDPQGVILSLDLDISVLKIRPIRKSHRSELDEVLRLFRRLFDFPSKQDEP